MPPMLAAPGAAGWSLDTLGDESPATGEDAPRGPRPGLRARALGPRMSPCRRLIPNDSARSRRRRRRPQPQLQQLASMKEAGILDDAEFAAAKAKLLS